MRSGFLNVAYEVLQEAGKPLHSKEITRIALKKGWLKTAGKTPEATMNARLIVDINNKKERSRFVKTGPSIYSINKQLTLPEIEMDMNISEEKTYRISADLTSKQKGDIAEARVAELILLYGKESLSIYKPMSDDEGIDLIVKKKGSQQIMFIQVKSRYGNNPNEVFTATTKTNSVIDNFHMAMVFCFFDTIDGDLWESLWFIPAPDFKLHANRLDGGNRLGFVAGRRRNEDNKWDSYLIDKRDLANKIIQQMSRY